MMTEKDLTRRFKAIQKTRLIQEVNSPKSALLSVVQKMENTPGCTVAARQLAAIVARLEDWQHRHKPD